MKWNVAGRQQILIVLIKPVIINWGGRTPPHDGFREGHGQVENTGPLFVSPQIMRRTRLLIYSASLHHITRGPQERRRSPFSIHFTADIWSFSRTGALSRCFHSGV